MYVAVCVLLRSNTALPVVSLLANGKHTLTYIGTLTHARRSAAVQEDLLNILFCYARCHPELSYRQGMHELLAGLYYNIARDADCQARLDDDAAAGGDLFGDSESEEGGEPVEALRAVMDKRFVAHDAHTLFCAVMDVAAGWFAQTQEEVEQRKRSMMEDRSPFASQESQEDSRSKSIVMVSSFPVV